MFINTCTKSVYYQTTLPLVSMLHACFDPKSSPCTHAVSAAWEYVLPRGSVASHGHILNPARRAPRNRGRPARRRPPTNRPGGRGDVSAAAHLNTRQTPSKPSNDSNPPGAKPSSPPWKEKKKAPNREGESNSPWLLRACRSPSCCSSSSPRLSRPPPSGGRLGPASSTSAATSQRSPGDASLRRSRLSSH
jgi:hypothetical protein